jgi:hypothetical protein
VDAGEELHVETALGEMPGCSCRAFGRLPAGDAKYRRQFSGAASSLSMTIGPAALAADADT